LVRLLALLVLLTTARAETVDVADGEALFVHEWVEDDPRSASGDGLGPLFNATSCAACHNQGGVGGAGDSSANVELLPGRGVLHRESTHAKAWENFRTQATTPDHHGMEFGCGTAAARFFDQFRLRFRQTPTLFGTGLLDSVSEADLLIMEAASGADHPDVSGRIARDADGRPGRFGWKAQTSTLTDFVAGACGAELGLETRDFPQAIDPTRPKYEAPGVDLTEADVASLAAYVGSLEAPPSHADPASAGAMAFRDVGCTACHAESVGDVRGAYTDLLVHDLGFGLADSGESYGVRRDAVAEGAAESVEWRTPPLWGLAASGPYLHDGRAPTLDQAIAAHDGEAAPIRDAYAALPKRDQAALLAFLRSI